MSMQIVEGLKPLAVMIEDLHHDPRNPRRGDVEAIARSLQMFGQRKPVVAKRDGTVIAGNHMLSAAKQLGWTELAAVFVDDNDTQATAYGLADNRTADLGTYDNELLAELIEELAQQDDEDLFAATGYTDNDLQALLDLTAAPAPPIHGDPDDMPTKPVPRSQEGDVWHLGRHVLVCGDSSEPATMSLAMEGHVADMVWTDPPYGVNYEGHTLVRDRIDNDQDDDPESLMELLWATFKLTMANTQPGAIWFVAGPPGPNIAAFTQVLGDLGIWRQTLVWVKDSFVVGHSDYHYRHESLFYGWTPGAAHVAPPDRTQDSLWEIPRPKASKEHPTMKPVALVTRAISNHTNRSGLIVDPFAGSGTTLIAAEMTGRTCRAIEIDPGYCDVICKRYELATGNVPTLDGAPYSFT